MTLSSPSLSAALAAALALAACSAPEPPAEPAAAPAPEAAIGERCVGLAAIRNTKVVDDSTIDFHMRDGRVLRNTLPHPCPSLGFEEAFTYATSLSQLCSTDIITVVQQGGGPRLGASCGLGTFVPHTPIKGE
ncbi:hypothetical protein [Sphingosinicella microcystinivorans]|uniref:hypothetical protein n=1 Tax=Sphingosinicella microcystinivorans TaxID=335406 RepID=UPI0022F3A4E1|nr:hypothetical protein [Sphingosinicella microcystinivorans]WBX85617.1 hypothetical protein PE061_06805 [Sphingosinicella microcystinivorans]